LAARPAGQPPVIGTPVTVVVVTRNRRAELLHTLERLTRLPERPAVVVVDNGSRDGTPRAVAEAFPGVTLLALGGNAGPAARTLGVRRAGTDAVAFSDDDSWWAPGALARAADVLAGHPSVGLIAGRVLVGPDERLDPTSAAMACSPLPRRPGLPGVPVLGFVACAAVVRRRAYLEAGGFSAAGVGGEERLLAWDLASAGWQLVYLDDVMAHHHPSATRDGKARARSVVANELRTAWLRRPLPRALRHTLRAARLARDAAARRGLADLARDAREIARERRPVPPPVERQIRALEAAARPGAGSGLW
jgi:GT2 family glycosyltransferase